APIWKARRLRQRFWCRSSSTSVTGSRPTTSDRPASDRTGRTPRNSPRSREGDERHDTTDEDHGADEESGPPHPCRRAAEPHGVGDRLALPVLLGTGSVAAPDLCEARPLLALPGALLALTAHRSDPSNALASDACGSISSTAPTSCSGTTLRCPVISTTRAS